MVCCSMQILNMCIDDVGSANAFKNEKKTPLSRGVCIAKMIWKVIPFRSIATKGLDEGRCRRGLRLVGQ